MAGGLEVLAGEDVEFEVELVVELVLPLVGEAAGADHETALEVAADEQLAHVEAGHHGLAGAGVVGEEEAQRVARQQLAVDRGDLVRQGLDERGGDGEVGVEEVGVADAQGLRGETEEAAVGVEGPGVAAGGEGEGGLVGAEEDGVIDAAAASARSWASSAFERPSQRDAGLRASSRARKRPSASTSCAVSRRPLLAGAIAGGDPPTSFSRASARHRTANHAMQYATSRRYERLGNHAVPLPRRLAVEAGELTPVQRSQITNSMVLEEVDVFPTFAYSQPSLRPPAGSANAACYGSLGWSIISVASEPGTA